MNLFFIYFYITYKTFLDTVFSGGIFLLLFFLLISQIFSIFFLESSHILSSFSLLVFILLCLVYLLIPSLCKGNCLWTLSPFYIHCALLLVQFKENLILSLSLSHTRDRVSTMLFTKKKNLLSCAKHFFL